MPMNKKLPFFIYLFTEEGMRPIFDRDEIKHWIPDVPEKRVVAMIHEKSGDNSGKRSLSPIRKRVKRSISSERQGIQHRLIRVALRKKIEFNFAS